MFDSITETIKDVVKSRFFAVILTYILLFSILIGRMFYLQIIRGRLMIKKHRCRSRKLRQ